MGFFGETASKNTFFSRLRTAPPGPKTMGGVWPWAIQGGGTLGQSLFVLLPSPSRSSTGGRGAACSLPYAGRAGGRGGMHL